MNQWRLLLSGFNDPYTNMAIDEAIAREQVEGSNLPTLRLYGWSPASFSLGYFQKIGQVLNVGECKKRNLDFVRRFTGGEIIFHDQELTYSISCAQENLSLGGLVKEDFKKLSAFILYAYKALGLAAEYFSDSTKYSLSENIAGPLCFSSKEDYDIIIAGKKIGGSAQRRIKNTIFQHGSIPLKLDLDSIRPLLKGNTLEVEKKVVSLGQALGREVSFQELSDKLIEGFEQVYSIGLVKGRLTPEEEELAGILREKKYKTPQWNLYRKSEISLSAIKC